MSYGYKILNKQKFVQGNYSLVPIRMEDRYDIMKWRNEQIYYLRQNEPLTRADQDRYFNTVVKQLFETEKPNQMLFSFLERDVCIGYGGLVHISWQDKRAEMSFLIETKRSEIMLLYEEDFSNFIKIIKDICFSELHFNKLFTETYSFREFHIKILERAGFKVEGCLRQHVFEKEKYYDSIIHSILKQECHEK